MKMRKVKYMKGAWSIILALLLAQVATAQTKTEQNSPVSIEMLKAKSLWFNSGNGAGLILDNLRSFSFLEAGYTTTNGDFKLNQQGEKESVLGIVTEGGQKIGDAYAWGSFSYDNITTRDSRFNTAMLDPFRGVPFYPVDPNLSDWKKQEYNLKMKVASKPLWDRYIFGVQGLYNTQTGAKQIDPRSEIYYYSINVKPGVAAFFGNHQVGLNLEYENMIQETRGHTNSNSQVDQNVFVMKGLGNHYTSVIGGLQSLKSFVYNANKVGGEFQYSYDMSDVRFFLNGGYTYRVEDVISDVTKPKKEGTLKESAMYANFAAVAQDENLHRLDVSFRSDRVKGIEYVQVLDLTYEVQQWVDVYSSIRSTYDQDDIRLSYDFYRGAGHEYSWKAGLFANYRLNDDLYIMPRSRLRVKNLYMGANGKVNIAAGTNGKLVLGADFIYKNNIDDVFRYRGADPASIVITQFMTPDFEYLKQNYYKIGGAASYFTTIGQTRKNGMFLKVAADYYKPTEGEGNRVQATFGVGFTF